MSVTPPPGLDQLPVPSKNNPAPGVPVIFKVNSGVVVGLVTVVVIPGIADETAVKLVTVPVVGVVQTN